MRIINEKTKYHRYAFEFESGSEALSRCQWLKESLGWKEFSFTEGKWRFTDPSIIKILQGWFPDIELPQDVVDDISNENKRKLFEEDRLRHINRIKDGGSPELLTTIKGLKGEPYDYQKLGAEFMFVSGGRTILADAMGSGKSLQTIAYVLYANHKRTLVVCPASVKFSWENEINKWTNKKSYVVSSKTVLKDIPYDVDFVIINYDILKKFYNELMSYRWDCIVGDESHMLKSTSAIRSKIFKQLSRNIPHVILLTGTPILSRPIELFNLLNIIDPSGWNDWYGYARRYCGGRQTKWGFEAKGADNLEELNMRINRYFLRRTREQVLSHLPPKNYIDIPIDLPKEFSKQYVTAKTDLVSFLRKYKKSTNKEIMKSLSAEKLVKLNHLREISCMGKVDVAKELIQNIIDSGEKVLVFSSFTQPLMELKKAFDGESVMIIGSTPIEERGSAVNSFQNDSNIRVFLGGIKSAGTGITLTAATNVVFLDYSWNPADMAQAEARAHRIGVKGSVNIYQITSRGTIDGYMKMLVDKKQNIFNHVIEGKHDESEGKLLDEMIQMIQDE